MISWIISACLIPHVTKALFLGKSWTISKESFMIFSKQLKVSKFLLIHLRYFYKDIRRKNEVFQQRITTVCLEILKKSESFFLRICDFDNLTLEHCISISKSCRNMILVFLEFLGHRQSHF